MTMVKVFGGITKREDGLKLIDKLNDLMGSNFYNIRLFMCPAGGSFDLYAESDYGYDDESQLLNIVNNLIISGIYLNI